jgi:DNA-binding transcriptional MerR regulator
MSKGSDLLTTSGVARRLSVAEVTVRSWVRLGRLRALATTQSGIRLFDPVEVERLAAKRAADLTRA